MKTRQPSNRQHTMAPTYYAVIASDNSGPALGIGTTPFEAWDDACEWAGVTGTDDVWVVEITPESYARIANGNPDAVTLAD